MEEVVQERSERAKWLLANAKHAAMATVNEDGSPHNSPFFFMASTDLTKLYWGSHPESQHSQNILRTGQLFVVLYEANDLVACISKRQTAESLKMASSQQPSTVIISCAVRDTISIH